MNPIQQQLAALRHRLLFVTTFRGACLSLALLLGVGLLVGLLDWVAHLPSLVRAILFCGTLVGVATVAYKALFKPLSRPSDDLSLALKLENQFPEFGDVLGSAVQFLGDKEPSKSGDSPTLRHAVIRKALRKSAGKDFNQIVSSRGVRFAGVALAGCIALLIGLTAQSTSLVRTGFLRQVHPFGGYDWPRQTQLELGFRSRVARGEPFEIRGKLKGVIPDQAHVTVSGGDAPTSHVAFEVRGQNEEGAFVARLESGRVARNFRFQVRAHDAVSPWHEVEVLPPPQLSALSGRPSPQMEIEPPAYTQLVSHALPDGVSSLEAPAGSVLTLAAAADRKLSRAWLETPSEVNGALEVAAGLSSFMASPLAQSALHSTAASRSWKRIEARLDDSGYGFSLRWLARLTGTYNLRFEDELGIGNSRLVDLRTQIDPAPQVQLERPSATTDSLLVLPGADLTIAVNTEDPLYSIRSVYLEYRLAQDTSAQAENDSRIATLRGRVRLYDPAVVTSIVPALQAAVSGSLITTPTQARPQKLALTRRWSLKELPLREGDVLVLQACADDYDDVTVLKDAGRSGELELRIVSKATLELSLNEAQARIQQEIVRLRKLQQEALQKVLPAEALARNQQGRLDTKQLDELLQAEQLQQQVRSRVGTPEEGLQADARRVLQALRDNQLPRTSTQDRMETIAGELERIARENLPQVEPKLTEARRQSENRLVNPPEASPEKRNPESAPGRQESQPRNATEKGAPNTKDGKDASQSSANKAQAKDGKDASKSGSTKSDANKSQSKDGKDASKSSANKAQSKDQSKSDVQSKTEAAMEGQDAAAKSGESKANPMQQKGSDSKSQSTKSGEKAQPSKANAPTGEPKTAEQRANETGKEQENPLAEARKNQEEVDRTLGEMLRLLEPWSSVREVKGEAQSLLQEQRDLQKQTEKLAKETLGQEERSLTPEQRAEAERATETQSKIAERTSQLLDRMDRLAEDRKSQDPETARNLKAAADQGKSNQAAGKMQESQQSLRNNELARASRAQEQAGKAMEEVVKQLEERRDEELERLVKKMKDAENKLDDLMDKQEQLQKKAREAAEMKDPQKREEALKRLAREQEELQKETQDLLRELSRMRSDRAAQALSQAGQRMQQAGNRANQGQNPDAQQEEALDRLQEAQDRVAQAREQVEEELARERLAQISDLIKAIKDRHTSLGQESERIHNRILEQKEWRRELRLSLTNLADAERDLGGETERLAKDKLDGAKVFSHLLKKAGDAMRESGDAMTDRLEQAQERAEKAADGKSPEFDPAQEELAAEQVRFWQKSANRRLDQLLEAMKPDNGNIPRLARQQQQQQQQQGDQQPGQENQQQQQEEESGPDPAQLKALKVLQEEVLVRTQSFAKRNPDTAKLNPRQQTELRAITQEQQEVSELFHEITTPSGKKR